MHGGGTAKQLARWTALGALFLLTITPLIVVDSLFFPFITGKAFFFRIVVEIAFGAWVVLALVDKNYRPRFSWVGAIVVAFVVWMFVADLFALNVGKAFFSNFERMEGWILLIHLLGLFFVSSAVLRVEKKWRLWFLTSLVVSVIVSGYALLQLAGSLAIHQGSTRIDATFGNSAYLAIYFLFNVFIALWLALTERTTWFKWLLIGLAVVETTLLFFTETRGTVLGLIAGFFFGALLTALTSGHRVRRYAFGTLAVILVVVGGFYSIRSTSFVQSNHVLQRIASISLSDGQTRFTVWHMAFRGAAERPLVGWGQEGFNYVFNKYYEPSLFGQESWFDRAHNAFIDWLSAGGVPAFLLYVALFGSALVLLWWSPELSRVERIALTGALVGYAVHNVFVFDNLYSYIYFFAVLALIDSQVARPISYFDHAGELTATEGSTYALPIVAVAVVGVVWLVNITGISTSMELITALSSPPDTSISIFQDLVTHPSFAAQEIREQLVQYATQVAQSPSVPDAQKQQIVSLAVSEMQKQVASYPQDARERLQLAYAYRTGGDIANSLKEVKAATELSPNKEEMWIELGATEWDQGDPKAAQAAFAKAYALGPQFPSLAAYAAAGDFAIGDVKSANAILMSAFGTTTVDNSALAVAYFRTKNWQPLINIWKLRVHKPDADVSTWFHLAAAYYAAGDTADAIATVQTAVKLHPEAAANGAAAIKEIQSGAPVR